MNEYAGANCHSAVNSDGGDTDTETLNAFNLAYCQISTCASGILTIVSIVFVRTERERVKSHFISFNWRLENGEGDKSNNKG